MKKQFNGINKLFNRQLFKNNLIYISNEEHRLENLEPEPKF